MGNPKKPTRLKVLEGNPGKRKISRREPKPGAGDHGVPSWICAEGKRIWKANYTVLRDLGLITEVDGEAFAMYCECAGMAIRLQKEIHKTGTQYQTIGVSGGAIEHAHPNVALAQKYITQARHWAAEFGCTPASRGRLEVGGEPDKSKNPFAEFVGNGSTG